MSQHFTDDGPAVQKHELEDVDFVASPAPQLPKTIHDTEKRDIGKEEQDAGSPSDTDVETEKPTDSDKWDPQDDSADYGGWESHEDPGNPKNWSIAKKVFHTAIPAFYGFVITVGTSSYVPAVPLVMERFHVGREVALLPLSLYTAGFTIGPILAAPLSELYGRKVVYWSTMTLLLTLSAIASTANNIAVLIIFRFLAGVGGAGSLAVGAGTIADLWDMHVRGRAAVFYIVSPFLGTSLGPLVGAYIISEYNDDWRWSIWAVMITAAPIAVMALFMSETAAFRILYLRQKKPGQKIAHQSGDTAILLRKLRIAFTKPIHLVISEPLVAFTSLYTGFAFAMMFSFFSSYDYVFKSVYGFDDKDVGLTFIGLVVGFVCAVVNFVGFDATLSAKAVAKADGKPAPEHRLYTAMVGCFMLSIGLFWFAWSPWKDVHWIVPVLAGVPFGWGCLSVFLSVTTYLVDVYLAANAASALAANGILRYGLGAVFPLFTLQMYEAMGVHWAGSVFAFVSLLGLPVPWVFYRYGKVLRARSKYETSTN